MTTRTHRTVLILSLVGLCAPGVRAQSAISAAGGSTVVGIPVAAIAAINADDARRYGSALVLRAADFPEGLSGLIECDGLDIPASEVIILTGDLEVRSHGPIIIEGHLAGLHADGALDGASIILESPRFIRITGTLTPGDGNHASGISERGGNSGDITLRAPFVEVLQPELIGGSAGDGGLAARAGDGGTVAVYGLGALINSERSRQSPAPNFHIIGGAGGDGGDGVANNAIELIRGGAGGNGGDANALPYEPAPWMLDQPTTHPLDENRFDAFAIYTPLTHGGLGASATEPGGAGGDAPMGICAFGGEGGQGGNGAHATERTGGGHGGRGGAGGNAHGGNGGTGGRGGDFCGPPPLTSGPGGPGGRGGRGGKAIGGNGGRSGGGGNGSTINAHGGSAGPVGMPGGGRAGHGGTGGDGGHGYPDGGKGGRAGRGGLAVPGNAGNSGRPGTAQPGGIDGSYASSQHPGVKLDGMTWGDGRDGLTCFYAYPRSTGLANPDNPTGNGSR